MTPNCEIHTFCPVTALGCAMCEGERLAALDKARKVPVRRPKRASVGHSDGDDMEDVEGVASGGVRPLSWAQTLSRYEL